jgi:hypothetical protein
MEIASCDLTHIFSLKTISQVAHLDENFQLGLTSMMEG